MHLVFIASEAKPFAQTGGLADVAESLPEALMGLGVSVSVILPGYRQALASCSDTTHILGRFQAWLGSVALSFDVRCLTRKGRPPVYLIDRKDMYDRPDLYGNAQGDYYDNAERFIFFCRSVVTLLESGSIPVDVVHCNDWQTGLIPVYLQIHPFLRNLRVLFTVHNLGYPGLFPSDKFPLTGLDRERFYTMHGLEFYGHWSMLKAGLVYSAAVNTVSPTYAREIQTPAYGQGLDGLLRSRSASVHGILNGVNYDKWDPSRDTMIPAPFNSKELEGKRLCKRELIRNFGLDPGVIQRPLIGIVSRLDVQKGIDLVESILDSLVVTLKAGMILLGMGVPDLCQALHRACMRHPGWVVFVEKFDERFARWIIAGTDMILIPSRYEPCGLTQLYAMKYGTLPVVRATGGLQDTVVDEREGASVATGFKFDLPQADDCMNALKRAVAVYDKRPDLWYCMQQNAMHMDFSWNRSAHRYLELYRSIQTVG